MNMMSFFRHRSFGLGSTYRTGLARELGLFDADLAQSELDAVAWHPGQSLVSRWARLPEEDIPSLPPLNLRPDHHKIAQDDRFAELRPVADGAYEDPADLLLRLIQALRRERSDKRRAGRFSALSLAWRLRKLDRDQAIDARADGQAINEILTRMTALPD